jgi:hypothetical protein
MEPNIIPKPYRHPDETFKLVLAISIVIVISDLLQRVASTSTWLAEAAGIACSLPVVALVPPRLSLRKLGILSVFMGVVIAIQYLIDKHFHLYR